MRELAGLEHVAREDCWKVLERLKESLGENLISLLLYGSVARGEGVEHSDYDFYVIARNLPERPIQRSIFLRGVLFGVQLERRYSIRSKRPEEMKDILPLFLDLATDGIILYDKGDFAKKFFEKVLRKTEERKLVRYRTEDGYYGWRFEEPIETGKNMVVSLEG